MDADLSLTVAYDPRIDRIDVALRMLFLARKVRGGWKHLGQLGLTRQEHNDCMDEALLEATSLNREDDLMRAVEHCPFLLDAAEQALVLYWNKSASGFEAYRVAAKRRAA